MNHSELEKIRNKLKEARNQLLMSQFGNMTTLEIVDYMKQHPEDKGIHDYLLHHVDCGFKEQVLIEAERRYENQEPELEKRISRCFVCEAIQKDEILIPKSEYDPKELEKQGFHFQDVILSKLCAMKYCGDEETARSLHSFKTLANSCPR